ncbi:Endonuclease/exonuclease/phosphatase [Scheffersomyces amazonensis]|uniref:Endonuclease/exonuclease/phosphatase n=1 Tax=Scheffersomyces amazonensis TaxID=1078765 RepID=UPI00315D68BC
MGMALGRLVGAAVRNHKEKKRLKEQLEGKGTGGVVVGKPLKLKKKTTVSGDGPVKIQIQIYTHNIRLDAHELQVGEEPWKVRKPGVVTSIVEHSKGVDTLVGLQEVLHRQLIDIQNQLGEEWKYIGVGRDDGETEGEYAPIFYQPSQWEVQSSKTYWLSDTPDKPSKGWDAAHNRIVVVGHFKHKASGKEVILFNTHFDHEGQQARINSAQQIVELITTKQVATIVAGDFNSEPHDEAYTVLANTLVDSYLGSPIKEGPEFTNTTFDPTVKETRIDYIWSKKDIDIIKSEVLTNKSETGLFSDHRPVVSTFRL